MTQAQKMTDGGVHGEVMAQQPSVAPRSLSLVPAPDAPETASTPAEAPRYAASPAPRARGPWFYRLQGAALTGVAALAVLAAARFQNAPLEGPRAAPAAAATADPSAAFADAFAQTARVEAAAVAPAVAPSAQGAAIGADAVQAAAAMDGPAGIADAPEAEVIARIAAADPPYKVVLHIAQDASPRDIARLDTAIRAWGFSAPEQRAAAEAVALPEVAFHAGQDREAALIVARIADSILAEAVLTPPAASAADPGPAHSGLIDVYVTTR